MRYPRLLLLLLPAACGEALSSGPGDHDADDLPHLVLREELRIGHDTDPDLGFSQVRALDVDRDGNLYVLEGLDRHVRVYDAEGRRTNTIGRPGEGPGEFTSGPLSMGLIGDTLWVTDRSARRTTLFERDGTLLSTLPHPQGSVETIAGLMVMLSPGDLRPDGRFNSSSGIALPRGDPPRDTAWIPRLVFDRNGAVVDTLGFEPFVFAEPPEPLNVGGQEVTLRPSTPEDRPLYLATSDDGVVIVGRRRAEVADGAEISLTWLSRAQDTVARTALRYRPRPFDEATIDMLVGERARFYERRGLDPEIVAAAFRGALDLPRFQAPVSAATLARDGSVVLRREMDAAARWRWILIAPDGTARGAFELGQRANVVWMRGDVVWSLEPNELDVPWLVKYRIVSPS